MRFKDNKQEYKKKFDEDFPFITKDQKLMTIVARLCDSWGAIKLKIAEVEDTTSETKKKPVVKVEDLISELKKNNCYNPTIMQVISEIAQIGSLVTLEIKANEKNQVVGFEVPELKLKLKPGETDTVTNEAFRKFTFLRDSFTAGSITLVREVGEEFQGEIEVSCLENIKKYFIDVQNTYLKFKDKPFKVFEHRLRMHLNPTVGWREITDTTFRVGLDMGEVYLPAPREYINSSDINKHFYQTESIAFAYVHEMEQGVFGRGKKTWVIDEFQSDIVEHLHSLSDSPETKTWYNPEGKSRKARFRTGTENYYKDWHKVLMDHIIRKAKELEVDEVWMISGKYIYEWWKSKNGFSATVSTHQEEKTMKMFRRYYDNLAMEYREHMTTCAGYLEKYNELVDKINRYYDSQDRMDIYIALTESEDRMTFEQNKMKQNFSGLDEEQRKKKIEGIDVEKCRDAIKGVDIRQLKTDLDAMLYSEMPNVRILKEKGIYEGAYNVIDLKQVP